MQQWLSLQVDKKTGLPTGNSSTWQHIGTIGDIDHYCILRTDEGVVKRYAHSFGYTDGQYLRLFRSDSDDSPFGFMNNANEPTSYTIIDLETMTHETWTIDARANVSLQSKGIIIEGEHDGP